MKYVSKTLKEYKKKHLVNKHITTNTIIEKKEITKINVDRENKKITGLFAKEIRVIQETNLWDTYSFICEKETFVFTLPHGIIQKQFLTINK
jgi:hypothetical protein